MKFTYLKFKIFSLIKRIFRTIKYYGFWVTLSKIKYYIFKRKDIKIKLSSNELICFNNMIELINNPKNNLTGNIYLQDTLKSYDRKPEYKKVLLISHQLDLTGAPIALYYFAKYLLQKGYYPVIISPLEGNLIDTVCKDHIPVIILNQLFDSDYVKIYSDLFDLIILNTILCSRLVYMLSNINTPLIWWIHEASITYQDQINKIINEIGKNTHIYCVGEYAKKLFINFFPNLQADILLYYLPDYSKKLDNIEEYRFSNTTNKVIFCSVGVQEKRKGQDILVDAIEHLKENYIDRSYFIFIGRPMYEPIGIKINNLCKKYPNNVIYINEVSQEHIKSIYQQIDCLICTSRDDPMPIVLTEALMLEKIIICSENTGSANFITDGVDGFIYQNNNYIELSKKIKYIIDNINQLDSMRIKARKIYQNNFSKEIFEKNLNNIINNIIPYRKYKYAISVIIPTYNAGDVFEKTLRCLFSQNNVNEIEIVVVDSGSKDNTVNICKKYNVNLIQIPNKDFSHSYARNLGAEKSNGEIFLFMTQDALPSSQEWLHNMIIPIVSGESTAVSCRELCPDDADLYYQISSFFHAKYIGILEHDIIGNIKNCKDIDSLRKNASLNNIACAIKSEIFHRFKYRFNFAEDLDLGIRLLRSGYKIKLLSNVKVTHFHNRTAGYYLKRAFVEYNSYKKIFYDNQDTFEDENIIGNRILQSFCIIIEVVDYIDKIIIDSDISKKFIKIVCNKFDKVLKKPSTCIKPIYNTKYSDDILDFIILVCNQTYSIFNHPSSINFALEVKSYLEYNINFYLSYKNIPITNSVKQDICSCLVKNLASHIGVGLSLMGTNCKIINTINEFTKGI